jgi:hypothetical protein
MGDGAADTAFVSTERMLSERQIDFDIVGDDVLTKDLIAGNGTLETASGNRYGTVILPSTSLLSQTAVDRLRAFAGGGGHVLFLGRTPLLISGRTILDARAATPADFSWVTFVAGELPPTPTPPAQPPTSPPAAQVVPEAIAQAVNAAVVMPDVTLDKADTALRVMRRRWKDADVYLFFNEGGDPMSHRVALRSGGRRAEIWDPQTGKIAAAKATRAKGAVRLHLELKPYATSVVVVR